MDRKLTWSSSNATIHAANQTLDYSTVLQEVSKHSIHLNYFERLWAVSPTRILTVRHRFVANHTTAGLVPMDAERHPRDRNPRLRHA